MKLIKLDKGIPDITANTISYLIKRGSCICGAEVKTGNDTYMELNDLLNFIPPKSIGTTISNFVDHSEITIKSAPSIYDEVKGSYTTLRENENDIDDLIDEIKKIEDKLAKHGKCFFSPK